MANTASNYPTGGTIDSPWDLDAEETCCDMKLFGEANEIECSGVVAKCRACETEICDAHSAAGLCPTCVREFVLKIVCRSCGIGCLYDGLCGCPSVEPLTLEALDECLSLGPRLEGSL